MEIPNSEIKIDYAAFFECSSLTSVKVHWVNPNYDKIRLNVLFTTDVFNNASLYVPSGTADLYRATLPWSNFGEIIECPDYTIGDVNGDGEFTPIDIALTAEFVHGRRPEGGIPEAADANGDGRHTPIDISLVVSYVLAGTNQLDNIWKPE